jgi:hypothetical protein
MMQSGAGLAAQDPPDGMAVAWLEATSNQSQDKADCIYTNIELPQADLPSQSSSQSRTSLSPLPYLSGPKRGGCH